jgi:hypothetical protein
MHLAGALAVAIASGTLLTANLDAADLKPATLAAFDRYVRLTEARMAREVEGRSPFLWIDRQPDARRGALLDRLRGRGIVSDRLETRDGSARIDVSGGMIHHWIGTVLLGGVSLDRAMTFLRDYDRYAERFGPTVQRSRVLRQDDRQYVVRMRTWARKKLVTVVHDADYVIDYRRVSPARMYTRSVATNVFHVESAGEPDERPIPGDRSSGYLWRLQTYCWFEERAEGTYEQCESISLTRAVPFGFGWALNWLIDEIPRETLEFTLGRVRDGLAATDPRAR